MPHTSSASHNAWIRTLAAVASMSSTLALGEDPAASGFHRSAGRFAAMHGSAAGEIGRLDRGRTPIRQVSADDPSPVPPPPAPPAAPDPQDAPEEAPAMVRVPSVLPPDAFGTRTTAEVQYLSSAWPGHWCPPACSDIAFRPLGDSLMPVMGRQVYQGAVDLMTLYDFDFYSAATERAAELTPRGQYQLRKFAGRLGFCQAPITVQFSDSTPELSAARRVHVIEHLSALGVSGAEALVVLGRARFGVPATEAVQTARGLESVIENRGRTVTPDSSARFGTGRSFGGFGR